MQFLIPHVHASLKSYPNCFMKFPAELLASKCAWRPTLTVQSNLMVLYWITIYEYFGYLISMRRLNYLDWFE